MKMTPAQRDTFDTLPRNGGWIESAPDTAQNLAELGRAFPDFVTSGLTGGSAWRLTNDGVLARHDNAREVAAMSQKSSNPKDAFAADKLPLHLWPASATAAGSIALLAGALKYGRQNYRAAGARASVYATSSAGHIASWFEGEDVDPDDGVHHLWLALANIAILIDADAAGKLTDDRSIPGGYSAFKCRLTPHVARLRALHADKTPHHHTIADTAADSVCTRETGTPDDNLLR